MAGREFGAVRSRDAYAAPSNAYHPQPHATPAHSSLWGRAPGWTAPHFPSQASVFGFLITFLILGLLFFFLHFSYCRASCFVLLFSISPTPRSRLVCLTVSTPRPSHTRTLIIIACHIIRPVSARELSPPVYPPICPCPTAAYRHLIRARARTLHRIQFFFLSLFDCPPAPHIVAQSIPCSLAPRALGVKTKTAARLGDPGMCAFPGFGLR